MKYKIAVKYPGEWDFEYEIDSDLAVDDLLEDVFGKFNRGSGSELKQFVDAQKRSLSVNDFTCINGTWYQCMSIGWEEVPAVFVAKIDADVRAHSSYTTLGAWFALDSVMHTYKTNNPKL